MIDIRNNDCLKEFKNIKDKTVDLIVTDCPYHIVAGGCTNIPRKDEPSGIFNRRNTFTQANAKTGKLFNNNDIKFSEWLPECYRVLKERSHMYIFISPRNIKELQIECEKVGFKYQQIIIWKKNNSTPNRYYLNNYEMILMVRKGKAKNINNMGTKNVIEMPNIIGKKSHPTEKPVKLIKIFIENSSNDGDIVLDPFMGSGSCAIACKELNRSFIGIEIEKKYYDIALKRIDEVQDNQITIFDIINSEV